MKRKLFKLSVLALLVGIMAFANTVKAEKIKVDSTIFPDEGLRKSLSEWEFEEGGEYFIETEAVTRLEIQDAVYNIKGIELLTNLERLDMEEYCGSDLTITNAKLKTLYVGNCTVAHIVIHAPNIEELGIWGSSAMTGVDITDANNVSSLQVYGDEITTIVGLDKLKNVTRLEMGSKSLTDFTINDLPTLTSLKIDDIPISELNVDNLTDLNYVYVDGTKITSLDLTSNKKLLYAYCYRNSNMTSIKVPDSSDLLTI